MLEKNTLLEKQKEEKEETLATINNNLLTRKQEYETLQQSITAIDQQIKDNENIQMNLQHQLTIYESVTTQINDQ